MANGRASPWASPAGVVLLPQPDQHGAHVAVGGAVHGPRRGRGRLRGLVPGGPDFPPGPHLPRGRLGYEEVRQINSIDG